MFFLRFFANPAEAFDAVNPASPPQVREMHAIIKRIPPFLAISDILQPALMLLIRLAMMKGIRASITASPIINMGVSMVGSLYSPTLFSSRFII